MLFNSIEFLIFFPIVVMGYFIIPHKLKYIWLLLASYYFYMSWNPQYALLIAISTLVTWGSGLLISAYKKQTNENNVPLKKLCLVGCCSLNLGILFFFKYYGFVTANIMNVLGKLGISLQIPTFDVLLPVGISFYTFQALGYVIDVYRDEITAEKSLLHYALFISFFPQLVAGPIERSKNLLIQIHEPHYFNPNRVKDGLLLMGWGFFEKMVIADRIALLVTDVYNNYTNYTGLQISIATILFAFQIYCDFAGYSNIAIGAARVMGFQLMKNFNSPYYANSVKEFWHNWHISLTTWFRDYIYIPLGGNRHGKLIKYRNLLITFVVSGLWHGASWNYVAWGVLNGFYQIVGDFTKSYREKLKKILKIKTDCGSYHLFQGIITFMLIDFSWLFFRADRLKTAFSMIKHGLDNFSLISMINPQTLMGINTMGMPEKDFYVMLLGVVVLMLVDYFRKRVNLKASLARQNIVFRYLIYYILIFTILIFGVYGSEYDASTFIYFQF